MGTCGIYKMMIGRTFVLHQSRILDKHLQWVFWFVIELLCS